MNEQKRQEMLLRTKQFALSVVRLYCSLQYRTPEQVLGKQLLRSGTSVGAHYREACRAKSNADFVSKIEGALEELDEAVYWLELLRDANIVRTMQIAPLLSEANQLISIFVTVARSVKRLPRVAPHPSSLRPHP